MKTMWCVRRWCLSVLLLSLLSLAQVSADVMQSQSVADSSALPKSWRQYRQREPVFGSELFWVEAGAVGKPAVLAVHGLGQEGLLSLAPVLNGLSRDYHVIALDLPGFGFSGRPSGRYTPTNYARVLHWLLNEVGVGPVAVFGHSMGAAVALRFTANYPRSVERLILVNAAGILQRTAFLQHAASLPTAFAQGGGVDPLNDIGASTLRSIGRGLVAWSNLLPDTATALSNDSWLWKTFVAGQPSVNAAMSLMEEDFSSAITGLNKDTYIIVGTGDPLAPPRTGRLLAGSLARAELFEMFGADHMPMHSSTDLFMTLLRQALTARGVGEPFWQRPKRVWRAPDLICDQQNNQRYSGYYNRVELRNCDGVLLENVSAQSVHLIDSVVRVYNLQVRSEPAIGITLERSELELTNAQIEAQTAIRSLSSRVDVAGLTMRVRDNAVVAEGENRVIVSVSELRSPGFQGYVHGSYKLVDASLDAQLR